MKVLLWHVHGSWTTAFVQGRHQYFVPVLPDRGADGRGRARTWAWPGSVVEITPGQAAETEVDVVILQRPRELHGLAQSWLGGRVPGRDVPAIYLEHNAPQGRINDLRHPAADRNDLLVVHVTHFNQLFWDTGTTPTRVIEHGIVDPGERYTGELPRAAVVINEPVRRGRVTGTDLLPHFARVAHLDLFGMQVMTLGRHAPAAAGTTLPRTLHEDLSRVLPLTLHEDLSRVLPLTLHEDLPQWRLHQELSRRRVYLHPIRWTSLGLSLLEAMHLGMPVVGLATTEVVEAVPPEAGVLSTRIDTLVDAVRRLIADPEAARQLGKAARAAARERYGLERFLDDWDAVLAEVAR